MGRRLCPDLDHVRKRLRAQRMPWPESSADKRKSIGPPDQKRKRKCRNTRKIRAAAGNAGTFGTHDRCNIVPQPIVNRLGIICRDCDGKSHTGPKQDTHVPHSQGFSRLPVARLQMVRQFGQADGLRRLGVTPPGPRRRDRRADVMD